MSQESIQRDRGQFSVLGGLQKLGRALMLPIAVLPVAGILLRLGSPDVFDIALMKEAGAAIFSHLALIFAIGVATGISRDNAGAAALAGGIAWLVLTSALKSLAPTADMGVLAGMISGLVAGMLYNRFHRFKLPEWLAFFGGKRFVPIVSAGASLLLAVFFSWVWPPLQMLIQTLGSWMIQSGATGAFAYGLMNRLLIPTGLHQVINSLVWFVFGDFNGAKGDLGRFFAGDPTAGSYMAGFYPVMMFGLPAACLAMYRAAQPERKKEVAGILLGVSFTSIVTGVTEPAEFLFMFLAPMLYLVHALLTGLSMAVCWWLGVKAGFTFSAGAIDFALNYKLATSGWLIAPLGALWFFLYYGIFSFAIRRFDIKTPGREAAPSTDMAAPKVQLDDQASAQAFLEALGGKQNLTHIDACITRLRLLVRDLSALDEGRIRALGGKAIIKLDKHHIQIVVGTRAELLCDVLRGLASSDPEPLPRMVVPSENSSLAISAPVDGEIIGLDQVPDEVFSGQLAGDGMAIVPKGNKVVAPCDGIVAKIFKTNHAFAMKTDTGAEILVHVGLDTVGLNGRGFTRLAQEGQRVKRGDPVFALNLDLLKESARSLITPIVVANSETFKISRRREGLVSAGLDPVFTITPV